MTVLNTYYTLASESLPVQSSHTYSNEIISLISGPDRKRRKSASLRSQCTLSDSYICALVHYAGGLRQRVVARKKTVGNHPRNNRSMFCIIKLIIHVKVSQQ